MKFSILLLAFIAIANNNIFSQDEEYEFPADFKRHTLKISPLKPLGGVLPAIELGYEKFLTKNTSAQITLGYLMENIYYKHNQKGFSIALEAKKYIGLDNRFYVSLETGFYHRHSDEGGSFESKTLLDSNNSPLVYGESFSAIYNQLNLIPKFGIRAPLGKKIILDAYFGIGIKWINITHKNRTYLNDQMIFPFYENVLIPNEVGYPTTIVNGNVFTVKIPFNIRIGYTF